MFSLYFCLLYHNIRCYEYENVISRFHIEHWFVIYCYHI